jgi:hypothetical protein
MATVQEKQYAYFGFIETKSVIKTQRRYRTEYGKDPPSDNAITFGDGYSVMKQRFTYQRGQIAVTAEYGDQETLTPFEISKEIVQR